MSGPYSRVIEAVAAIAAKLGATVTPTGNRLADNLDGIASVVTPGGGGGGGSDSSVLVVGYDQKTGVLNKTWQEIYDAAFPVIRYVASGMRTWLHVSAANRITYEITASDLKTGDDYTFKADSADGYPVYVNV